jgi:hypothetical protein
MSDAPGSAHRRHGGVFEPDGIGWFHPLVADVADPEQRPAGRRLDVEGFDGSALEILLHRSASAGSWRLDRRRGLRVEVKVGTT